jgi:3-hydroxyacyl-CoA dehydrogenase
VADEFLKKGLAALTNHFRGWWKRHYNRQRSETLSRLKNSTKFEDLADCDIVIEAVTSPGQTGHVLGAR